MPATPWDEISGLPGTNAPHAPPDSASATPPSGSIVDGTERVRILWTFLAEGVEFIAVREGTVYATTDTQVIAASLDDGTVLWRHSGEDYFSGGESIIGSDGHDLWVIAPYNSDIRLDISTGRTLTVGPTPGDTSPSGFIALDAPAPINWNVVNSFGGAYAKTAGGLRAWQLRVTDSCYEGGPVIAEGGLTIVPASDGYVYAIAVE